MLTRHRRDMGICSNADLVLLSEAKNLLFEGSKKQILRPEPAPSVVEGPQNDNS